MIVYRIYNKLNGKSYIGQTKQTLARRVAEHINSNSRIGKEIKRFGRDNFDVSIIDTADTQEALDKAERYWIEFFDAVDNGYNCLIGGKPTVEEMNRLRHIKRKGYKKRKKKPVLPAVKRVVRFDEKEDWKDEYYSTNRFKR